MEDAAPVRRAQAALGSLETTDDPRLVLDAARRLREAAEEIEQAAAAQARWAGATWHEIGALYGTTKQGAQQRFGKHLGRQPRIDAGDGGGVVGAPARVDRPPRP